MFITHSYGGLLLKMALLEAARNKHDEKIAQLAKAIFFLGAPHEGTDFITLFRFLACFGAWCGATTHQQDFLLRHNKDNMRINKEFDATFSKDGKYNVNTYNFFESRPEKFGGFSFGRVFLVVQVFQF
jgi:hypothetical protein